MNVPASGRRSVSAWFDDFVFNGCNPLACSILRIGYSVLLIICVTVYMIDAEMWFTDQGVLTAATAEQSKTYPQWSLYFWYPNSLLLVNVGLALLMTHSVLLLVGCYSRIQSAFIFFWLCMFHHRNVLICDGEDTVFRLFAFMMIFMPLDAAYAICGRKPVGCAPDFVRTIPSNASAWAVRLVQFELTAIYASAAWSKWCGASWRDGTALYYVSRMQDVFGRFWLPDFLFETPWILATMTWSVLVVETTIPVALWIRSLRPYAVAMAIGLHLGIEYSMHLFLFEWIMMVGLVAFMKPQRTENGISVSRLAE